MKIEFSFQTLMLVLAYVFLISYILYISYQTDYYRCDVVSCDYNGTCVEHTEYYEYEQLNFLTYPTEYACHKISDKDYKQRLENSNCKNWQSLQVQYQLPYYMDSKIQTESLERQGGRCA